MKKFFWWKIAKENMLTAAQRLSFFSRWKSGIARINELFIHTGGEEITAQVALAYIFSLLYCIYTVEKWQNKIMFSQDGVGG